MPAASPRPLLARPPERHAPWHHAQAGAAARAAYGQDPASRYMPHLSLLYADIPGEQR